MAYLIVACHGGEETKEATHGVLKSRVAHVVDEIARFDVPEGLKFGSFDSLIKLMDDLAKIDSQIEATLRRVERHILDLDPRAEFKIISQRKQSTLEAYIRSFTWDDHKFPRTRALNDNLSLLWSSVQKLDDEVKSKASNFSDIKQQWQNLQKGKQGGTTLNNADLVDVLTPEIVSPKDFIETEHLTTVLVVVPRNAENQWVSDYESFDGFVVPQSTKKFRVDDKDGNTLWRVILFKSAVEKFKQAAKMAKYNVRDYTYCEEDYRLAVDKSQSVKAEYAKQEQFLRKVCHAAFSDTLVAWLHLKAMRVFVEAVLRYGVPPNFAAFILKPSKGSRNATKLRTIINDVFSASGLFGQSYNGTAGDKHADAGEGAEEAYYPYVSLNMVPLGSAQH